MDPRRSAPSRGDGERDFIRVAMLGRGWFPTELGGLDRYFRDLLEHLPEAGGVVIGPAEDPSERVRIVSDHRASMLERQVAMAVAARKELQAAAVLDVHFALYGLLPVLASRRLGKPLLVHFQGPWADENVTAGDHSRLRRTARRTIEKAVYRRADAAITLTAAFKQVLVESYGVIPWKVAVLAPGVDLQRFSPGDRREARARLKLSDDDFVACCVRRLVPRMGVDVLVDAWRQAFANQPGARLIIAGDGDQRPALERQIKACGLTGQVCLLGPVDESLLVALYRASDVNVVPSLAFEGFGLVVLEAAGCGTPSVVSRVGGLPEAIFGLDLDLVVAPGNCVELAARLHRAAEGQLPSRAKTHAWVQPFSWDRVAGDHRKLLSRLRRPEGSERRRLRVVYLDHVAELSGAELSLSRLAGSIRDADVHVIVAAHGPLVPRLLESGVSVEVLRMSAATRSLRKDDVRLSSLPLGAMPHTLAYVLRLAWRLRQLRPDVVHTNSLKAGVYGILAARLAGVPVVWQQHDRLDGDYLPGLAVGLIRLLLRLPQVVINNSESTQATTRRTRNSFVIAPISASTSPTSLARNLRTSLVVGMVGRLAPWKGQDVFLRAFAEAFADGDTQAWIIGDALFGEQETMFGQTLRDLAIDLGIADRVVFRGHREDIANELAQIDVLVHASVTPEPFGQVLIEGMSAGLPVVAPRAGGPLEIIADGTNGLLYDPGNSSELAGLLTRLGGDPKLRQRLGAAATVRAADFSPDVLAERFRLAYETAVKSHSRSWRDSRSR